MNTMDKIDRLLRKTGELAGRQGISHLEIDLSKDLGDAFHVYGVNLTPAKLLAMLKRRNQPPPE